jgi:DNA-binding CsgD family transcriptional regulator
VLGGTIVGRDAELAVVDELVAAAGNGTQALLIEGDAGIGKTTVWHEAVRRAEAQGFRILASRAGQAEARLTFVGLADLLAGVDDSVVAALPAPQRAVLDAALMRVEADPGASERALASAAFLSVLRALASAGPVAVACDDLQWLDASSYAVLEFALRRLATESVLLLATRRLDADGAERTLADVSVRRLRLGPLSLSAIHRMLLEQLGQSFPRPVVARIEQTSGGNPLFAVELGRAIVESGETATGSGPLPVPADLQALIGRRLERLPRRTRTELLLAAALSQPRAGVLDLEALAPAERAGLVRIDTRGRTVFAHPLYAAAVYGSATASERRAAHARLAGQAEDLEERARHLALATDGADAEIAALLEEASERAASRGAPAAAADLAELAVEVTPPADRSSALRRKLGLADALFHAGDGRRSRALLEEALRDASPGRLRCEALSLLALVLWHSSDWRQAIPHCTEALAATTDRDLAGRLHAQIASMGDENVGDAAAHARAALDLMDEEHDPVAYGFALLNALQWEHYAGHALDRAALEHGLDLIAAATPAESGAMAARWARALDELSDARLRYERFIEQAIAHADEPNLCIGLAQLATLDCWLGDLTRADESARRSLEVADQTRQQTERGVALHAIATVAAYRGEVEVARGAAERMLAWLRDEPDPTFELMVEAVLGFVDCSVEEYAGAAVHLARANELLTSMGWREPTPFRFQGDEVEAAVGLGELELARSLTTRLEERGRANPIPWTLATAARCRGLVVAAEGDLPAAERELEAALAEHERLEMPLERARTLLALGQVQRRRKERLRAKETLEQAREICERMGAKVWADRARRELARVGLRRGDPDALTPSEQQVALFAASGLTNREIAERAFMSAKTVEANLARAYRKLGIHSRAELGRVMAEREAAAQT